MMNQYEVPVYLATKLPGIKDELQSFSPSLNIFKAIQCLANYTKNKISQHDMQAVKKCFAIGEIVYLNGNQLVKNAIENVFVYAFSSFINMGNDRAERNQLQAMMPLCLHTAYVQQVLKPGI